MTSTDEAHTWTQRAIIHAAFTEALKPLIAFRDQHLDVDLEVGLFREAAVALDQAFDDIDSALRALEPEDNEVEPTVETHVEIPCTFYAEYVDGKIARWVVTPSASAAGFFGPPAAHIGGWPGQGDEDLDVTDLDGPFWQAVRTSLNEGAFHPSRQGASPPIIEVHWEE